MNILPRAETCFFEHDPGMALARRAAVEGIGTLLLMLVASGSAQRASLVFPDQPGLGLVAHAVATSCGLVALVTAFGSASGGHFNPLITGLQWLARERRLDCTLAYVAAQLLGAGLGAWLSGLLFAADSGQPAAPSRILILSEAIASAGLMIIVFGCARSGRAQTGPFAVGAWLCGAILTMPSGSCANPAIAVAALFAAGPAALPLPTVLSYLPAEIVGALLALLVISIAYPARRRTAHRAEDRELSIKSTAGRLTS